MAPSAWIRLTLRALALAAALLPAWWPAQVSAQVSAQTQVPGLQPVPALTSRVVDTIGLLDPAARQSIDDRLAALEREKGSQVAFLIVATTAPEDIASFANRVANEWKVGRRAVGDGVLLVVARDDRKLRIEVAKTLEGAIPDLAAKRIIDESISPAFKRGDYADGLAAAADRIGALVRGEALPPVQGEASRGDTGGFELADLAVFLFFVVPIAATVLRGIFGRKLGSLVTGGGVGLLAFLATTSLAIALVAALVGAVLALAGISPLGRRSHHGRWGGPPSGGWGAGGWSGGAGGGGGFSSGGGGDFGGGGASGDW